MDSQRLEEASTAAGLEFVLAVQALAQEYLDDWHIPSGVRTVYTNEDRGEGWTGSLLADNPGASKRLYNLTRLRRPCFVSLSQWLTQQGLKDGKIISVNQKLAIFMSIVALPLRFSHCAELYQHSTSTVSACFHEVLNVLLLLHKQVVKPPANKTPNRISQDPKMTPFIDCIGALDGTHIPIWLPDDENRALYRNHKGFLSQNVLAVCDFEMNFVFISAGWEGSAHDGRVLRHAIDRLDFVIPAGRYYLGDAGYSASSTAVLSPYLKTRYHLREQYRGAHRPVTAKELFNLRHSSLRNVIERTFGVLKARFAILKAPATGFSVHTQIKLVYALTAVHNFINAHGGDPEMEAEHIRAKNQLYDEVDISSEAIDHRGLDKRREEIANRLWEQYQLWWQN